MTLASWPAAVKPTRRRTSAAGWHVTVATDLSRLEDIWPHAADANGARFHIFQSAEFLKAWIDTIGRARRIEPFFCVVHRADGRPALLLPLAIEMRQAVRVLTFVDGGVSDYNAPIILPGAPELDARTARRVLDQVLAALPPVDLILFEKMPQTVLGRSNPLWYIGAAEPWAESGHLAITSAPVRHSSRFNRRYRKLARRVPVSYVLADDGNRQRILARLFAQKHSRFIETRVPGFDQQPGMIEFYTQIVQRLHASGVVHLAALCAGGEIIATQLGLRRRDHYYSLVVGFEGGAWRKYSPGILAMESMLEWCHTNRIVSADFGIGDESYKFDYCERHLRLYRVHRSVTLYGRVYLAHQRLLERLRGLSLWQRVRPYKWRLLYRLQGQSASAEDAGRGAGG